MTVSIETRSYYNGDHLYVTALKAGAAVINGATESGQKQSVTVTVYDPDNTAATHIYVDQDQENNQVPWLHYFDIALGTTSAPSTFGNATIKCQLDYLDASGSVISSETKYDSVRGAFAMQDDRITIDFGNRYDLAQAYAKGTRRIRFTLLDDNGGCIQYAIGTSTDLATLNVSSYSIGYEVTGVNEDGETMYVRSASSSGSFTFAEGVEETKTFYLNNSDLSKFVASSATNFCIRLLSMSGHTLESDCGSIVIPLQDASK